MLMSFVRKSLIGQTLKNKHSMKTKYRITHEFNLEKGFDPAPIYYVQCKVLFLWHTIGCSDKKSVAMQEMVLHDTMTKDFDLFARLLEVWGSKFL